MRSTFALLLAAALVAAAAAQTDGGAALVARKSVHPTPAVVGSPATVSVEVFNAGSR
jgi:isochorismate synthase EntC